MVSLFFIFALIVVCRVPVEAEVAATTGYPADIYINSTELVLEAPPTIRNGEVFVPLTDTLAMALGADIETGDDAGRMTVALLVPGSRLEYVEGETTYRSGGAVRSFRQAPFTVGASLAVPAISLFSELGFDVELTDDMVLLTKKIDAKLIQEIPESMLVPGKAEKAPEAEEVPQAAAPGAATEAGYELPEQPPFQYTYENSFEFVNIAVSGDAALSNLIPETSIYNKFGLRLVGALANGYDLNMKLRSSETNNHEYRQGEVNNFFISGAKGGTSLTLYDLNPRISRFVLKNYTMQGIEYDRTSGDTTLTAIWGKTPKRLYESFYNRYVDVLRAVKQIGDKWTYAATHVRTRDTGVPQITERSDNKVLSLTADYDTDMLDVNGEYAFGSDRVFHGPEKKGKAVRLEYKQAKGRVLMLGGYERISNNFTSETTFFTPGRREYSMIMNMRLNPRTTAMTGTRSVLLMGEATTYLPLQINSQPFKPRPKMKLTLNVNNEKSRNISGSKLTENRQFIVSDWFGETKLTLNYERRTQRSYQNYITFRTNIKAQMNSQFTDRLSGSVQYRRERKYPNSKPLSRFSRIRLEYELKEWNDLGITYERYYNGTDFNRTGVEIDYRLLDNINDTEISASYGHYNFRAHNDNNISLKYSYTR